MKLALEIIKREIAQRELANKHNHLRKDEINKELESLQKIVNFISSNPVLADSKPRHCPKCNSTNVIMFDSDNDLCNDCGAYFC